MKVLVAGDYAYSQRLADKIKKRQYDILFDDVKEIIETADVSIINYENPVLLEGGKYIPISKQGPNLQSPPEAVDAISYAGFNAATLANNHILDYGEEGCLDAIRTLENAGIETVGAGRDLSEAQKVLYKRIGNQTLAIINCCEHEFSVAQRDNAGANPLNPIQQFYSIQEAKHNADFVIVIVHGGHEHFQLPSLRMQETYRFFIESGADAVVNHHQHCFSGYEFYKQKPIVYGVGNFCFDSRYRSSIWNSGYLAVLDFNKNNINLETIPYIQCDDKPGVFRIKDETDFNTQIANLNAIIVDKNQLTIKVKQYYESNSNILALMYEPYLNRYFRKLRSLKLIPSFISRRKWLALLNMTECEAHRDKVLYMMHQNIHK